jgi:hypothetical protein
MHMLFMKWPCLSLWVREENIWLIDAKCRFTSVSDCRHDESARLPHLGHVPANLEREISRERHGCRVCRCKFIFEIIFCLCFIPELLPRTFFCWLLTQCVTSQKAKPVLTKAAELDRRGQYDGAFKEYLRAIDILMLGIKCMLPTCQ